LKTEVAGSVEVAGVTALESLSLPFKQLPFKPLSFTPQPPAPTPRAFTFISVLCLTVFADAALYLLPRTFRSDEVIDGPRSARWRWKRCRKTGRKRGVQCTTTCGIHPSDRCSSRFWRCPRATASRKLVVQRMIGGTLVLRQQRALHVAVTERGILLA
jgi:hypothetical protein